MFPHLDGVRVERVCVADGVVRIAARICELTMVCPDCGRGSARVHSRYGRRLADVAVGGRPVVIELSVRRLLCDSPSRSRDLRFIVSAAVHCCSTWWKWPGCSSSAVAAPGFCNSCRYCCRGPACCST
ncbi:transposase family protein [Streptomyces sp. NPDC049744]|uniref:transposase family protein n=1 Tax=Streptomyces sp. NPDC049744 TaxID=3154359 RepID=UPI0034323BC4